MQVRTRIYSVCIQPCVSTSACKPHNRYHWQKSSVLAYTRIFYPRTYSVVSFTGYFFVFVKQGHVRRPWAWIKLWSFKGFWHQLYRYAGGQQCYMGPSSHTYWAFAISKLPYWVFMHLDFRSATAARSLAVQARATARSERCKHSLSD